MAPRRSSLQWLLIPLFLSLLALPMFVATARAAQPGEELLRIDNGVLTSSTTFTTVIPSGGVANFRLSVSGGTASDQITLTVRDGSTPVGSWAVRSGETSWGFATIPANATLTLQTTSAAPLNYTLGVYARDVAPRFAEGVATWSGTAVGAGIQSAVQINVPAAGRYRFTLGATSGKFQLKVDDNYLLKTVVAGQTPAPEDSTYYLSAGSHTLTIVQSSSETTAWSVALAPVSGPEALPATENTAVLGAGTFTEEWIPIQVASEQPVNIRIAATGAAADKLQVELYHGANRAYASAAVFGGEVAWGTSTVASGSNRLRIIADGNSGPLAYAITVSPVGGVPVAWNGVSYGTAHAGGGQPTFQVNFPQAALYSFKLSATAGRFQLVVPGLVRKTASDAGAVEFTAYVPAGPQTLTLVQDPNLASTTWNVEIAATEGTSDALPFSRTGGLIGGTGNAFSEEVLPLQGAAAAPANIKITASGGNPGDALRFELSNGTTVVYTATSIYNGEVFWATAELARGTNLMRVVANPANTGRMNYQVDVSAIPAIPATLEGVALGPGLNSTVRVNAPVAGIYNISLSITEGT
ncbi:MAG: hypothetical protein MUD01_10180 [Chloroflexaceae bacterium]|nr:hypothetical protein [Chloroflexaceae bacterium]